MARPKGGVHFVHYDPANPFLHLTSLLSSHRFRYDWLKVI